MQVFQSLSLVPEEMSSETQRAGMNLHIRQLVKKLKVQNLNDLGLGMLDKQQTSETAVAEKENTTGSSP